MKTLLSLDMSTNCTGWAVFEVETGKLIHYGILKSTSKGLGESEYPMRPLYKMIAMAEKIGSVIENYTPHFIVAEEISGSKNRLSQKTLDGLHWIVLIKNMKFADLFQYYDVSGIDGWRTSLGIRLSEQDKINNKEAKKINKTLAETSRHLPIYDAKDATCRFVNQLYKLGLDPQEKTTDADIGDAVAMGHAWLKFKKPQVL